MFKTKVNDVLFLTVCFLMVGILHWFISLLDLLVLAECGGSHIKPERGKRMRRIDQNRMMDWQQLFRHQSAKCEIRNFFAATLKA